MNRNRRTSSLSALVMMWLVFTPYVFLWSWNVNSYLNVHTDLSRGPDSANTIGTMEVTHKSVSSSNTGSRRYYRCLGEFTAWSGGPVIEVAARQLDEEQCVQGEMIVGGILVPEETTSQGKPFVYFGDGKHSLFPQAMGSILLVVLFFYPFVVGSAGYATVYDNVRRNSNIRRRPNYFDRRRRDQVLRRRRAVAQDRRKREERERLARIRREEDRREREERAERERQERIRREEDRVREREVDDIMARIHEQTERDLAQARLSRDEESSENQEPGAGSGPRPPGGR
ncbi:hypothetical protein [Nocardiopsis valliformis]|uniref:hypothetical protein n=1 Tax=Nocardiopsis valliformis TaxID=239974 RepID=UPI0012684E8B|nr:hypothetical protein [Nocardiopsis valliformis]